MESGCGIGVGVEVGAGVEVGVALGMTVGRGEEVGTGEADCPESDAGLFIPQALRIKDRMIQEAERSFILFILSL